MTNIVLKLPLHSHHQGMWCPNQHQDNILPAGNRKCIIKKKTKKTSFMIMILTLIFPVLKKSIFLCNYDLKIIF